MSKSFKTPTKHRCDECDYCKKGCCSSLKDKVYGWWTGCCVCVNQKLEMVRTYPESGVVSEPKRRDEMPLIGLKDENGKCYVWDDVAKGKGEFSDPVPVLMALYGERDQYVDFSATELLNNPLQLQLQRRYDYFESVDELLDRTMGSAFHALMEQGFEKMVKKAKGFAKTMISEQSYKWRVTIIVGGKKIKIEVGGTADLEVMDTETLWDYKTMTCSKLKYMANGKAKDSIDSYTDQMNIYRWLIKKVTGRGIKKMKVRAIVRDWRFYEFRRANFDLIKYPKGCFVPIKIRPFKDVEKMIVDLATDHYKAAQLKDDELGQLDECDTWGGIRCNNYCALKDLCPYRQEEDYTAKATKKKVLKKTNKKKKVSKKTTKIRKP